MVANSDPSIPAAARAFSEALAGALGRLGVRHACISPGSRNGPLSVAFVAADAIATWIHHDERSAGFFAVGLARVSGAPVVLVSTSGTAAAEYLPALIEARRSRVPLLVVTADRPPELRGVGAPQTIDQVKLYGDAAKWFHDTGVPAGDDLIHIPGLASHAVAVAMDEPAGPVHINVPFRQPLFGDQTAPQVMTHLPARTLRGPLLPGEEEIKEIAEMLRGKRVLIVSGEVPDPAFPTAAAELAGRLESPLHADPLSGLRHGRHDRSSIVAGDMLASAGWLDRAPPEIVLRFGGVPTSKPLWSWLGDHPRVPQIVVDPAGWRDPTASASTMVRGHPAAVASELAKRAASRSPEWRDRWLAASSSASQVIDTALNASGGLSEPGVARLLSASSTGILGVSSSLPIRLMDAYGKCTDSELRYVGNRGANGIDGTISMSLGAVVGSGSPGRLLIGDIAALHDLTALRTAARLSVPLAIVVLHNDGGGIFHLLPQVETLPADDFELVFGTPHGTDFVAAAEALGVAARRVDDAASLMEALDAARGPVLVEVRTDRQQTAAVHRGIVEEVRTKLRAL